MMANLPKNFMKDYKRGYTQIGKKTKIFFSLTVFFLLASNSLWALRIGFLPLQVSRSTTLVLQEQYPLLNGAGQDDVSTALTHLYQSVYELATFPYPFSMVEQKQIDALAKIAAANGQYSREQLQTIGNGTDSEALLVSEFSYKQQEKMFLLQTSLFYSASNLQTDYLQVSCRRATDCFFAALKKRFFTLVLQKNQQADSGGDSWIFLLDAAAVNQKEIVSLANVVEKLPMGQASFCAASADGKISFAGFQNDKASFARNLRSLKTSGQQSAYEFGSLLACGERQINLVTSSSDSRRQKPHVVFLSGSLPLDSVQTRGLLRRIAARSKLQIFGSSGLTSQGLEFWKNLGQELSYAYAAVYTDIIYKQRVGLADGQEVYIFKKGNLLGESFVSQLSNEDFTTAVPAHQADEFSASHLSDFYRQMSQNHVVAQGAVEIVFPVLTEADAAQNFSASGSKKSIRVLISIESSESPQTSESQNAAKPLTTSSQAFWLYLPNSPQAQALQKGQSYYFLVSLLPPKDGIPLRNAPQTAWVFDDKSKISSLLLLPITDYLKSPSSFLNQSLDKSSWYYILGRVKAVLQ